MMTMNDTRHTNHHAGDKASRILAAIHAQVRDAVESGNLPAKQLYTEPGVSRSTVARMLSDETPTPEDQMFSTLWYIIDRLPSDLQLPVIQTLLNGWAVTVLPKRKIETDLDGNGIVDAKDEREAAMRLLDAVNRTVRHIVDAVEDGEISSSEQAIAMRLRTEINGAVDQVVQIATEIAHNKTQRRKALTLQGPRMANAI
ncbi:MAG TPA: hypothetical protein DER01_04480 [Phycisphaerales bacterium]|nr:hypothetical protein [Phycisphaerales bacterium]|tara:strand:- start:716 stop:1315 length:600 start_codon:yes stop_codon:yes gene_type:complete